MSLGPWQAVWWSPPGDYMRPGTRGSVGEAHPPAQVADSELPWAERAGAQTTSCPTQVKEADSTAISVHSSKKKLVDEPDD